VGILKRIHINQHIIKSNSKNGEDEPVITVKSSRGNDYAHEVDILDSSGEVVATVVYSPCKPLSCGARVWIETKSDVILRNRNDEG